MFENDKRGQGKGDGDVVRGFHALRGAAIRNRHGDFLFSYIHFSCVSVKEKSIKKMNKLHILELMGSKCKKKSFFTLTHLSTLSIEWEGDTNLPINRNLCL